MPRPVQMELGDTNWCLMKRWRLCTRVRMNLSISISLRRLLLSLLSSLLLLLSSSSSSSSSLLLLLLFNLSWVDFFTFKIVLDGPGNKYGDEGCWIELKRHMQTLYNHVPNASTSHLCTIKNCSLIHLLLSLANSSWWSDIWIVEPIVPKNVHKVIEIQFRCSSYSTPNEKYQPTADGNQPRIRSDTMPRRGSLWLVAIGWMCTIHAAHRCLYYTPCIPSVYECKWYRQNTYTVCAESHITHRKHGFFVSVFRWKSFPGPMLRVWERALDIHNVFVCEAGWDTIIIESCTRKFEWTGWVYGCGNWMRSLCILVQDFVGFLWVFNLIGCMIHVTAQRHKAHFKGWLD